MPDPAATLRSGAADFPEEVRPVLEMFSIHHLSQAQRDQSFRLIEEVKLLITIMRSGSNRDRLAAQRQYRLLLREIAELAGYIASASQTQSTTNPDGTTTQRTAGSARLITSLTKDNPYGQASDPRSHRSLPPRLSYEPPSSRDAPAPATPAPDAPGEGAVDPLPLDEP